jgi:thymidylate kinase
VLKQGKLIEFLNTLDVERIPYVSWKNNHELQYSISGESDIDLYIPHEYRSTFLNLAIQEDWLCVENPVARYPWITHLYSYDDTLKWFHIHVYFKVITGESWLKEYQLPLERLLIDNRTRSERNGVWVLNSQTQAYLFALRHLLKGGSITSRLLYRKEIMSYRDEWLSCNIHLNSIHDYGPIRLNAYIGGSGLTSTGIAIPDFFTALRFRLSVMPLLRMSAWSLPAKRLGSLLQRIFNRYLFRRKKIMPTGGLVIAISGVDGAGKSTMLKEAHKFFSGFLTVRRYSLGRPQGRMLEAARKGFNRNQQISAHNSRPQKHTITSLRKAISVTVLALLRLRMARKAISDARRGYLVLVDRWPTNELNKMDGPRIVTGPNSGKLQRFFASIEHWAYSRMPMADVCFFLRLPLEIALERNRLRIKEGKETNEEIMARFNQNEQHSPLACKIVTFDNGGELSVKLKELLALMWKEVVSH